jgi:hypothetical protein
MALIDQSGIETLTINAIAEKAGVSIGRSINILVTRTQFWTL